MNANRANHEFKPYPSVALGNDRLAGVCCECGDYHDERREHVPSMVSDEKLITLTRVQHVMRKMRLDAESRERDGVKGIGMLRSWLRRLHMNLVFEGDLQSASQDEIARQLGEHPRNVGGDKREFTIDPNKEP